MLRDCPPRATIEACIRGRTSPRVRAQRLDGGGGRGHAADGGEWEVVADRVIVDRACELDDTHLGCSQTRTHTWQGLKIIAEVFEVRRP